MTVCIRDLDDKKSRKPIVRNFLNDTSSSETETVNRVAATKTYLKCLKTCTERGIYLQNNPFSFRLTISL